MSADWLDMHHGAMKRLRIAATSLENLAWNFDSVGNEKVALKLSTIAGIILDAADISSNAVGESISVQLKGARKSHAAMLVGMVARIK